MIRVLVVDDSAFMRKMISDFLTEEKQIEVIGTARNGEEALK
ncbi:chemotaxis response regulator protein-glutamate methylesterase, partial [Xanthomonas citri pv. citri]|nr:chemotaxis response regulator protein-glutamate methylesterase [Xanthomonas citri pv. citri]